MKSEKDYFKIAFAVLMSTYVFWCAFKPLESVLLHSVHLAIHEAGHLIFRIFGEFLGVAGGSLLQVLMPLAFAFSFWWREKFFAASIVGLWLGHSIVDVAVYAADAVSMQLVLLGGLTGSEGSFHDWNYLLSALGLLKHTNLISGLMNFGGFLIIIISAVFSILYADKSESVFARE